MGRPGAAETFDPKRYRFAPVVKVEQCQPVSGDRHAVDTIKFTRAEQIGRDRRHRDQDLHAADWDSSFASSYHCHTVIPPSMACLIWRRSRNTRLARRAAFTGSADVEGAERARREAFQTPAASDRTWAVLIAILRMRPAVRPPQDLGMRASAPLQLFETRSAGAVYHYAAISSANRSSSLDAADRC